MAKICKYCRSEIDDKASVCPHCQRKQSGGAVKMIIAAIAAVIFLPAFIGACSSFRRGYNNAKKASVEVATEATTEPATSESIVLYNQNNVKITYTGIEEKSSRYELKLLIENETDMNICVQDRDLSINGFMMSGGISAHVAPHKKANDDLTIYKSALEENKIANIENVELCFHIVNWDEWSEYFDSDTITINIEQ